MAFFRRHWDNLAWHRDAPDWICNRSFFPTKNGGPSRSTKKAPSKMCFCWLIMDHFANSLTQLWLPWERKGGENGSHRSIFWGSGLVTWDGPIRAQRNPRLAFLISELLDGASDKNTPSIGARRKWLLTSVLAGQSAITNQTNAPTQLWSLGEN